jgi:hypothetical protein
MIDKYYRVIFVDFKYVVTVRASRPRYAEEEAIKTLHDCGIIPPQPLNTLLQSQGRVEIYRLKTPEPDYWVRPL